MHFLYYFPLLGYTLINDKLPVQLNSTLHVEKLILNLRSVTFFFFLNKSINGLEVNTMRQVVNQTIPLEPLKCPISNLGSKQNAAAPWEGRMHWVLFHFVICLKQTESDVILHLTNIVGTRDNFTKVSLKVPV